MRKLSSFLLPVAAAGALVASGLALAGPAAADSWGHGSYGNGYSYGYGGYERHEQFDRYRGSDRSDRYDRYRDERRGDWGRSDRARSDWGRRDGGYRYGDDRYGGHRWR